METFACLPVYIIVHEIFRIRAASIWDLSSSQVSSSVFLTLVRQVWQDSHNLCNKRLGIFFNSWVRSWLNQGSITLNSYLFVMDSRNKICLWREREIASVWAPLRGINSWEMKGIEQSSLLLRGCLCWLDARTR